MTAKIFFHRVGRNPQLFVPAIAVALGYTIRATNDHTFNWGDFGLALVIGMGICTLSILIAWGLVTIWEKKQAKKAKSEI